MPSSDVLIHRNLPPLNVDLQLLHIIDGNYLFTITTNIVNLPLPFFVAITLYLPWIVFNNYFFNMKWFTRIIIFHDHICYTKIRVDKNSPNSLNLMINYHYHGKNRLIVC